MKIQVKEDMYYVSEDLSCIGMVSKDELECSYTHILVKGDVWEKVDDKGNFSNPLFKCIEGKWEGEDNDGWWDFENDSDYFEVL
jgi:hypothetical protein